MEKEKIFVNGMYFDKIPEELKEKLHWIKGRISIKVQDFVKFALEHEKKSGYINIDLCKAKSGELYFELNTYEKPTTEVSTGTPSESPQVKATGTLQQQPEYPQEKIDLEDIPF